MSASQSDGAPIPGDIHQWEHPNWAPILALVGKELTGWFMWMGELRLADGTAVHAFKHRDTRRYCHLAEDGRAYDYQCPPLLRDDDRGSYQPISRLEAIDEAFRNWSMAYLSIGEVAETTAWVNHARVLAGRGEAFDVDPAELELQRRFEEERRDKAA